MAPRKGPDIYGCCGQKFGNAHTNSLSSHRIVLRNISNSSRKASSPNGVSVQDQSPQESPRLHLRSSSSRITSYSLLGSPKRSSGRGLPSSSAVIFANKTPKQIEDAFQSNGGPPESNQADTIRADCQQDIGSQHKIAQTPSYDPYLLQNFPRRRPSYSQSPVRIPIGGLRPPAFQPLELYNPMFFPSPDPLNSKEHAVEYLDACISWSQMSITTAELLFVVQHYLFSTIEDDLQDRLQDLNDWYSYMRENGFIFESVTQHAAAFDLNLIINRSIKKVLDHPEYANTYVDVELIKNHAYLALDALNCIEWSEGASGKVFGTMSINLIPLVSDDPNWISPSPFPTTVELIKFHDSITFGDNDFVVREKQELCLSPEFQRWSPPLASNRWCTIKYDLGSTIPWLEWDEGSSMFRGTVPRGMTLRPAWSMFQSPDSGFTYESPSFGSKTLPIIIKATVSSHHYKSELRLKRVVRARVNLTVLPWWNNIHRPPDGYSSLRDHKWPYKMVASQASQASHTVPNRKGVGSTGDKCKNSLTYLFHSPAKELSEPTDNYVSPQERCTAPHENNEHQEPFKVKASAPSLHKIFLNSNSQVSKRGPSLMLSPDTSKQDAKLGDRPQIIAQHQPTVKDSQHPVSTPRVAKLAMRPRHPTPPNTPVDVSAAKPLKDRSSRGSDGSIDNTSLLDYVSESATSVEQLGRQLECLILDRSPFSVGGRFETLLALRSTSSLVSCDSYSETIFSENKSSDDVVRIEEIEDSLLDTEDNEDNNISTGQASEQQDSSDSSMLSLARLRFLPKNFEARMRGIQKFYEASKLRCLEANLADSSETLGMESEAGSLLSASTQEDTGKNSDNQLERQSYAPEKDPLMFCQQQEGVREGRPLCEESPAEVQPHARDSIDSDEGLSGEFETISEAEYLSYDPDHLVSQMKNSRRCKRKFRSDGKASGRPSKTRRGTAWQWLHSINKF